MVARVKTVAFQGIDCLEVDAEVQLGIGGMPAFTVVGLPDKAVGESRERVRAALTAIGLALPPGRITITLALDRRRNQKRCNNFKGLLKWVGRRLRSGKHRVSRAPDFTPPGAWPAAVVQRRERRGMGS